MYNLKRKCFAFLSYNMVLEKCSLSLAYVDNYCESSGASVIIFFQNGQFKRTAPSKMV